MKLLLFFIIGFVAVSVNAVSEDMKETARGLAEDCVKETKASKADMESMINQELPKSPEGKCLMACMMTQFGVVS